MGSVFSYEVAGGCPWLDDGAITRSGVGLSGADFNQGPHLSTHPGEEDALLVTEWESYLCIFSSVHFPDLLAHYGDFCFEMSFKHPCQKPWISKLANALPWTDVTHRCKIKTWKFLPLAAC